jgi:hypothetical protein
MRDQSNWFVRFRHSIARGLGKDVFLLLLGGVIALLGSLFTGTFEGVRKSKELEQVRLHDAMKREEESLQSEIASDLAFLEDVFLTTEADLRHIENAHTTMTILLDHFNKNPIQKNKRPPRYDELLQDGFRVNSEMKGMRDRRQEKRLHIERTLEWRLAVGKAYDLKIARAIYLITINLEALALTQFSNDDGGPWHFSPVFLQKAPPEDYLSDMFDKKRDEAKRDIDEQLAQLGQRYIEFAKEASDKIQEKKTRLRSIRWGQTKPPF